MKIQNAWLVPSMIFLMALIGCGSSSIAQMPTTQPPLSPPSPPSPPPPSSSVLINSISPTGADAGSSDLTLSITGTNLDLRHSGSHMTNTVVCWCNAAGTGTLLPASVISATQLTTVIPAGLLASPVTVKIAVQKLYFADDTPFAVSNYLDFAVSTVTAVANPTISPAVDTIGPNGTRQFTAVVNDSKLDVIWAIQEGDVGGEISSTGLYTAPGHPGTFHIIATPVDAPSESAMAIVTVAASGFTATGSMHVARSGHTATLLKDGRVLILGGGNDSAELFDPASGTFSFTGQPVTGRLNATATLLSDGKVLITGGMGLTVGPDGHLPPLNTAEIFDPATGTFFSLTGTMVQARWRHTATLLGDGRVLVAGGYFDAICITASTELFDPATELFSPAGFMLSERVGHTATLLATGEVLMAGGKNGCAPDADDDPPWDPLFAELFEPASQNFQGAGNMSTTRIGHYAIRLPDGKVLVLGGIPRVQNVHEQPPNPSYAEIYDPAEHTFLPVSGLSIAQTGYTANLLSNGMVLIAGGVDSAGEVTTNVLQLNPSTSSLNATGSLGTPRVGHTTTLLQNGRVLVTGGTDANGNVLSTAELYK